MFCARHAYLTFGLFSTISTVSFLRVLPGRKQRQQQLLIVEVDLKKRNVYFKKVTQEAPPISHVRLVSREKRVLALSCLSARMRQGGCHWTDFHEL